jgi:hypothetical protein
MRDAQGDKSTLIATIGMLHMPSPPLMVPFVKIDEGCHEERDILARDRLRRNFMPFFSGWID